MPGGERLELAGELIRLAEPQVGLEAVLQGGQPQVGQPVALGVRERLGGEFCERRPAPQVERRPQPLRRGGRVAPGERRPTGGGQALEAHQVEVVTGTEFEAVARRARQQTVGGQDLA